MKLLILALVMVIILLSIGLAGCIKTSGKRAEKGTTMKRVVWFGLCNGVTWVWCSYILAYLGREQIAESLSKTAVTEIIAVVIAYAAKALLEKREDFGAVGKKETPVNTDRDA